MRRQTESVNKWSDGFENESESESESKSESEIERTREGGSLRGSESESRVETYESEMEIR